MYEVLYEVLKVKAGNYIIHMIVNIEQISDVISHLETRSRLPEYRLGLEAILESVIAEYDCDIVDVRFVELW